MRNSLVLITIAIIGCADGSRGTTPIPEEPSPPPGAVAGLHGLVDVTAGTLTFEPSGPADLDRVRLAGIYGDQGVTVRLYNSPVVVANSATPGKETYTANVGLQNLLAFPIGDEQAGIPLDTMGI